MTTLAATLLRRARIAAGLSQRALAQRAGVVQPAVARAESGARDVTVHTLAALLRAAGSQLIDVPTVRGTVAAAAETIRLDIEAGDEDSAFREIVQISDDLRAAAPSERVVLAFAPPRSTGDPRWDNLIAGVVEHYLADVGPARPEWLSAVAALTEVWHVDSYTARHPEDAEPTVPAARRRGVVLTRSELESA